jgi:hypothetical protein
MKTVLIILTLMLLLSSCASQREATYHYYEMYPARAEARGMFKCGMFPKPLFKEKKWWSN